MNIDFNFDWFKFWVFHYPTYGIEIKENKGLLSEVI